MGSTEDPRSGKECWTETLIALKRMSSDHVGSEHRESWGTEVWELMTGIEGQEA